MGVIEDGVYEHPETVSDCDFFIQGSCTDAIPNGTLYTFEGMPILESDGPDFWSLVETRSPPLMHAEKLSAVYSKCVTGYAVSLFSTSQCQAPSDPFCGLVDEAFDHNPVLFGDRFPLTRRIGSNCDSLRELKILAILDALQMCFQQIRSFCHNRSFLVPISSSLVFWDRDAKYTLDDLMAGHRVSCPPTCEHPSRTVLEVSFFSFFPVIKEDH